MKMATDSLKESFRASATDIDTPWGVIRVFFNYPAIPNWFILMAAGSGIVDDSVSQVFIMSGSKVILVWQRGWEVPEPPMDY